MKTAAVLRLVNAAPGVLVWAEAVQRDPDACHPAAARRDDAPLLLIAAAGASAAMWPRPLVAGLARRHPVILYDHRGTGRSRATAAPYGMAELAADAIAVLDAFAVPAAHVLGWGMGGLLAQLMLLDHPSRLASVTLLATGPLPSPGGPRPPGPSVALRRLWAELDDPRDRDGELDWRLAHDRLLHGDVLPFDGDEFRARHERAIAHAGTDEPVTAHAHLDPPARGGELRTITSVPTLVIEAPADPVAPPPSAAALAAALGGVPLVTIPGLGHSLGDATATALVGVTLGHTLSIPTSA